MLQGWRVEPKIAKALLQNFCGALQTRKTPKCENQHKTSTFLHHYNMREMNKQYRREGESKWNKQS